MQSPSNFPRVSIIMNCYNGEEFLNKALDSIVQQTYSDWELIIVDDLSQDNTREIINHIASTDSRIKVIYCFILNLSFKVSKRNAYEIFIFF